VSEQRHVCEWCGETFTVTRRRGPAPRYCRPSHRQRAYEARKTSSVAEFDQPLVEAFDALDHALRSGGRLEAAARSVLLAAGRTPPPPRRAAAAASSSRRSSKPWKVLLHPVGTDPTVGELYTAHTTERAAATSQRRLSQEWTRYQAETERDRWRWSVFEDATGQLADVEPMDRDAALDAARRITTRQPHEGAAGVVYRCRPYEADDDGRPTAVTVQRHQGAKTTNLGAQRWSMDGVPLRRWGDSGYLLDTKPGVRATHPYIIDLLTDVAGWAEARRGPNPTRLYAAKDAVARELLPDNTDWELPASELLEWLEAHGIVRLVRQPSS
jgi:hypothetical protein